MSNYELNLPPERLERNAVTGRFMKGHKTHNKGRKWSEWMPKRSQRRASKGWKNLDTHRPKTRPDTAERLRRPVIGVTDAGEWAFFPYVGDAAEKLGISQRNISRCCMSNEKGISGKRRVINTDHRYKGIRWYYESDNKWTTKIKQQ